MNPTFQTKMCVMQIKKKIFIKSVLNLKYEQNHLVRWNRLRFVKLMVVLNFLKNFKVENMKKAIIRKIGIEN